MNNCKILLVDTPPNIKLLNFSTSQLRLPIEIVAVKSVSDALEIFDTEQPDMVRQVIEFMNSCRERDDGCIHRR